MSCRGHAAITIRLATAGPLETGQDPPCCEATEPRRTVPRVQRPFYQRSGTKDHEDGTCV